MVNHTRTLILNLRAPLEYGPGEEFIDPAFEPAPLSAGLLGARSALFGRGADRYGQLVTVARIMAGIDTSPTLREYARRPDPRVAYRGQAAAPGGFVAGPGIIEPILPLIVPLIEPTEGLTASVLVPTPTFLASGQGYGDWTVEYAGGGTARVTVRGSVPVDVPAEPYAGGKVAVGLPTSYAKAILPPVAAAWRVQVYAAPAHPYTAAARAVDPATIFRPGAGTIDQAVFEIWKNSPVVWEQAASAAVAFGRRVEELRPPVTVGLPGGAPVEPLVADTLITDAGDFFVTDAGDFLVVD